jgi:hypothetical protein
MNQLDAQEEERSDIDCPLMRVEDVAITNRPESLPATSVGCSTLRDGSYTLLCDAR